MIILSNLTVEANSCKANSVVNERRKSLGGTHERTEIGFRSSFHKLRERGHLRESLVASNAIFHELYEAVTRDASVTYNWRQRGNHETVQKSSLGRDRRLRRSPSG